MPSELSAKIKKARAALDLKDVDYEGTMAAKLAIARQLYDLQGHNDQQVKMNRHSKTCLTYQASVFSHACSTPSVLVIGLQLTEKQFFILHHASCEH